MLCPLGLVDRSTGACLRANLYRQWHLPLLHELRKNFGCRVDAATCDRAGSNDVCEANFCPDVAPEATAMVSHLAMCSLVMRGIIVRTQELHDLDLCNNSVAQAPPSAEARTLHVLESTKHIDEDSSQAQVCAQARSAAINIFLKLIIPY